MSINKKIKKPIKRISSLDYRPGSVTEDFQEQVEPSLTEQSGKIVNNKIKKPIRKVSSIPRKTERETEQSIEPKLDEAQEQAEETLTEQCQEQLVDQETDKSQEQTEEQETEQSQEQAAKQELDQSQEQTEEQETEQSQEQAEESETEQCQEQTEEQELDQSQEQAVESETEQCQEQTVETEPERSQNQAVEQETEQSQEQELETETQQSKEQEEQPNADETQVQVTNKDPLAACRTVRPNPSATTRSSSSGGLQIIYHENGKRMSFANFILKKLNSPTEIAVFLDDQNQRIIVVRGEHVEPDLRQPLKKSTKNGVHNVLYNTALIREIITMFNLDYSNVSSRTLSTIESETINGTVYVYIQP